MSDPAELPEILPLFPLAGVLLLPGGRLPLHVFELRYRNMVEDVLEGAGVFGMIQPRDPAADSTELAATGAAADDEPPTDLPPADLYEVGCTGWIERWEDLEDGRYLILLKGLRRFRIRGELPLHRGYRRVEADYTDFGQDGEETTAITTRRLMRALRAFGEGHQISFELEKLSRLPGLALLNSVAMALPFSAPEKQALLEARDVKARHEMLLTLMDMGIEFATPDSVASPN